MLGIGPGAGKVLDVEAQAIPYGSNDAVPLRLVGYVVLEQLQLLVALDVLLAQQLILLLEITELVVHPLLDLGRLRLDLAGVVKSQLPLFLDLDL